MFEKNIDIICVAETKIDSSFPSSNFHIPGYRSPYRHDVSEHSGGLLVYIKDHIPSKQLTKYILPKDLQIIAFEVNLRKTKWLLISIYRPHRTQDQYFLDKLSSLIDYYSPTYDNILILGDFNLQISDKPIADFLESHCLKSLNKKPTCFKSKDGKCIDLMLTNKNRSFKNTNVFETGMSDFHLMTYTMFKMTFEKTQPKQINYRSFKNFDKNLFLTELKNSLVNVDIYETFESIFVSVLDKHAPVKQKFVRANDKPFMNKEIRKAIFTRSRLKNKANKKCTITDYTNFKKQRNFIVNLNRRIQKNYYRNLDPNNIKTSKSFYQTFKPFFSSKYSPMEKLILVEKDTIISDDQSCAEIINSYLSHITDSLNIPEWSTPADIEDIADPVVKSIAKYANHPSILSIQSNFDNSAKFNFQHITPSDVLQEAKRLDPSKSSSGDIPIRIVKDNIIGFVYPLTNCFNTNISGHYFPDLLKLADVTPAFKKGDKMNKENYRPISVIKVFAKVLERLLCKQLRDFLEPKFSPLLCGFRKGHSTQHALLKLLEDWRNKLDNKFYVGTILCDLSKAFDTLPHDMMIAKLNAYGVEYDSLNLVYSYLTNRKQRCKVGTCFSSWGEIYAGVPQGSVLGPLLFIIFINDLFFEIKESSICNWADDQTIYSYGRTITEVNYKLENDMINTLTWFKSNHMVANPAKFQLMFLGTRNKIDLCLDINGRTSRSTSSVKLLGIDIDWKLTFSKHVKEKCKNAYNKTKSLARLRYKLSQRQKLTLYNSFVMSCFGYCPIIWMFCGKSANEIAERIQRKALRAIYNDYSSDYQSLLNKGGHFTIHEMNKRSLLVEVFKCLNNENPPILANMFTYKNLNYNLRRSNLLALPQPNTITYGLNSFKFRGSMAWNCLPDILKNLINSNEFKEKIRNQKVIKCNCQICI